MYDLEVGWELRVFITVSLFLRNFEKNKLSTAAAKCSCLPCPTTMTKINTPELDICKVGPPPPKLNFSGAVCNQILVFLPLNTS